MMKKIITSTGALFIFTMSRAESVEQIIDRSFVVDAFHIGATMLLLYLCFNFVLSLLQRNLDHRVKVRIIQAHSPQEIVDRLLAARKKDIRGSVLLWLCVLLAMGGGLAIIDMTPPFGLHSVAILACSVGLGLLVFYVLTRRRRREGDEDIN